MDATNNAAKPRTKIERRSDVELVMSRQVNGPARLVFEAWTTPELLKLWWVPQSSGASLASCEADLRPGGAYRFEFAHEGSVVMAFFGRYLEVVPPSKLVWTNEESAEGPISTLTFEDLGETTLVTLSEVYPRKGLLDENMASMGDETLDQLEALLAERIAHGAWPRS